MEGPPDSSQLPDGNRAPLEEIEMCSTGNERPGLNEWSGRFWLPVGNQVEPAHKYCLLRGDGRAGEMIMDRFGSSDIARPSLLRGAPCLAHQEKRATPAPPL
jgi:hypothetical protein